MATLNLPVRNDLDQYQFAVVLDGATYTFALGYNERDDSWSFQLYNATGDLLMVQRIVVGIPFTAPYVDPRLPPGELAAVDSTGSDLDPGRDDLGTRVFLRYVEYADLVATGAVTVV